MKIKYLGHACFLIISDKGIKIITDPFTTGGDFTYDEIKVAADIVTVSHDHFDHNNVSAVRGNPSVVRGTTEIKGIEFKGIPTYHDDAEGKLRGKNTIFCFAVDGIRICHPGDLGHQLSAQQVAELGKIDILCIPVGGFYTIDAKVASQICIQLRPKVIIPMHWNHKWSFPEIASIDDFLQGKKDVSRLDTSEIEFKSGELPTTTQIMVLKSAL
ncbi:MBL fold metallo-hydrolase [Chloroflexota bacterium]